LYYLINQAEHVTHALLAVYLVDKFSATDEQYKSFGIKYELDFSGLCCTKIS